MAKDLIHKAVKEALTKDGWKITDDPYTIKYKEIRVYADLAAERTFAAEREGRKIAVEVKSFLSQSPMHDFELALGQYRIYRRLLKLTESDRQLFLAVNHRIYQKFFIGDAVKVLVRDEEVSLLVVNVEKEELVQWIN